MKVDEMIENFKSISPEETVIEKRGAWVYVNGRAYRAKQLQEIYEGHRKQVRELLKWQKRMLNVMGE